MVCFDHAGRPDDVPFFLRCVARSASARRGFVFDDRPTAATFTPDWRHGVNAGPVTRTGVGRYTADFPGSAGRRGPLADLVCTTPDGTPADTASTVAHNLLDDPRKPVGTTSSPRTRRPRVGR